MVRTIAAAVIVGLVVLGAPTAAPAQAPTPDPPPAVAESDDGAPTQRGAIPAAAFADLASRWAANALHVKFVDEADLDEIDAVLAETVPASAVPRTGPLFARGSAELEIERSVAEADTGVGQVDLSRWWRVELGRPLTARNVLTNLNAHPLVEAALAEPHVAPAAFAAQVAPDYEPNQRYRDPAPDGIDADYAATILGGTGAAVGLTDIEYSWNTSHEDLTDTVGTEIANGTPLDPFDGSISCPTCHGTAVLGIIAADDNGFGVTGIVPDASIRLVNSFTDESGQELAAAIDLAAASSAPGDVILIEQQLCPVPILAGSCAPGWLPVEWFPSYYDAIVAAVNKDLHVVQAGGNGARDIDPELVFPDSGSVIVGAGNAPGCSMFFPVTPANGRLSFSNHGERVDVQSHGGCVWTTGNEGGGTNPDEALSYTGGFTGTSSAAAIVAGAVASLASVAKTNGTPLAPDELRALLRATGTPQDTSVDGFPIGPQPDLRAAIDTVLGGPISAPDNDDVDSPTPLTPPVSLTQATTGASVEVGEPVSACGFPDTTIWFEIAPTADVDVRMTVESPTSSPTLTVWRVVDDDVVDSVSCQPAVEAGRAVHQRLMAGERYLLQVANTRGAEITVTVGPGTDCDINGDGVGDLLIGSPDESVGAIESAGAVTVLYGSLDVFAGAMVDAPLYHQNSSGIAGVAEADDRFGSSLACGDIDGDGFDDAVIGVEGEDRGARQDTGAIHVIPGGPDGLDSSRDRIVNQATPGVKGRAETGDRFGNDVAIGDVNGDGYADIVVGVVGEAFGPRRNAGRVVVLPGGPAGVDTGASIALHQNRPGIPGRAERGDRFGAAVAVGDLDGDGYDDIAIGAPGEGLGGRADVGLVTIVPGSAAGSDQSSAAWLNPVRGAFGVDAVGGLEIGSGIAIGDGSGDGVADLFVAAPGAAGGASAMFAFEGGVGGPTTPPVINTGAADVGARGYGSAIAVGDVDRDGDVELVSGNAGGFPDGADGLTDAGRVTLGWFDASSVFVGLFLDLDQNTPGVFGAAEPGDEFGGAVLVRDLDDDGHADVVVAAPGEGVRGDAEAGMVLLIPGSDEGLDLTAERSVHQRTAGVGGLKEAGDRFGQALG